jgi:hypothetical protein
MVLIAMRCADCGSVDAMREDACPNLKPIEYCLDCCECPEHYSDPTQG